MKYCKRCLLPDTRPRIVFDKEGVCAACLSYERRKAVNWEKRQEELKKLCDRYRRDDGYYDCMVPVSGGKDSHYLLHIIKTQMHMNPILLTVGDPYTKTKAGLHNFTNIGDAFNCDHILFNLSTDLLRRAARIGFEEFGDPLRFVEVAAYTVSLKTAVKLGISLIVFGENSEYEYCGKTDSETFSANDYILKEVTQGFNTLDLNFWIKKGMSKKELNSFIPPTVEELNRVKPQVIFMSYFFPWSSTAHLEIAKRYGFKDLTHEWKREGYIEDFEQIDSVAYLLNFWLKYPKFGFQRTTDIVSRRIREGSLSIEGGKKLIMKNDHKLDPWIMEDFINFTGYTRKQFWAIVDKFWNREIFEKVNEKWCLKNPVYKDLLVKEK